MKKTLFESYLPFITILLSTIFQLYILFSQKFIFLLLNTLPDDAFYYFQTARNIVQGYGSTFDGVNLSNGYHPLWMLVTLPIFKFFSVGGTNDLYPIYISLTLSIILTTISAYFLYKIFSSYTQSNKIISLGLFVYLFNPYLIYNILNGLETSLVLFLLIIFIYLFIKFAPTTPSHSSGRRGISANLILIGIVGGLLALARLDMVIVVFFSYLYFLYKKQVNNFFIAGLTSAIIFLCWMIYNFKVFGIYLTSASVTSTFINHRLTYSDNGGESVKVFIKTIFYMLERATQQVISDTGAPIILLGIFGIGIYFFFKTNFEKKYLFEKIPPIVFTTLGLLVLLFVSAGLRWTFRSWYFIPFLVIESVLLVWVINNIWNEFYLNNKRFVGSIFLSILTVGILYSFFVSWTKSLANEQLIAKNMYQATIWQNENLGPDVHVGVFNAGLQAYFSNHKVTNLDGLINNNASKAMLDNTLWEYITETEHIEYIADFDSYLNYRYKDSFGKTNPFDKMEKIYTISGPKDLNIYKIKY